MVLAVWGGASLKHSAHEYNDVLSIFYARLQMKHLLKGTTHQEITMSELWLILSDEIKELDTEIIKGNGTKTVEEALDVMICALLIADKTYQEYKAFIQEDEE